MKLWCKGIFKIFALVAMLCVVGSVSATSTLSDKDMVVNINKSNKLEYNVEIEKINKELADTTKKLKEIESKNPKDKRILQYKEKIIRLIKKRHELITKNPKYINMLEYINSEEYQKMSWEIEDYNKKMIRTCKIQELPQIDTIKSEKTVKNSDTDKIYDNTYYIYVNKKDLLCYYIDDAYYVGYGAWVKLNNGKVYSFAWSGEYKKPESACNWILNYLRNKYHIYPKDINYVHIKYFIQGKTSLVYSYKYRKLILMYKTPNYPGNKIIELWSEATYYPNKDKWKYVGYPHFYGGGVNLIKNTWRDARAGFAFYRKYPHLWFRWVGGWETYDGFLLKSNTLHQHLIAEYE